VLDKGPTIDEFIEQVFRMAKIKLPLTHEEIAEFIGTTRETVTRTLTEFKNRQLVTLQGSTLMISNRSALESIGAG
jgi:CRP/FNR family cyclic AMP-dependent transcriptional regulator